MRTQAALALAFAVAACRGDVIPDTLNALNAGDLARAENLVRADRMARGVTPDGLEASSWIARAELMVNRAADADVQAREILQLYGKELARRGVDSDPHLATAVGAAIEVHAQALAAKGQRVGAVAFLRREDAAFAGTSIAARIRKNINLLTLVGHPAPAIDVAQWIGGEKPPSLAQLRGRPVLLFFWAHWCADCKGDAPVIANIAREYAGRALAVVGPTQLYGYTPQVESASPEQELAWTRRVFEHFYAIIPGMTVPVSAAAFRAYGASTTPTIVIVDQAGIVRLYHPGAMTEAELKSALERIVAGAGRARAAQRPAHGT